MRISGIELTEECNKIKKTKGVIELSDIVILTGENGAGKTRLLNLIMANLKELEYSDKLILYIVDDEGLSRKYVDAGLLRVVNFSHYDAILQSSRDFSPYVIGTAKDVLSKCNYEETALNALLVIQDMACGYSEQFKGGRDFQNFKEYASSWFGIEIEKTEQGVTLFGLNPDDARLSPGQQYLLRIAVACYFNSLEENSVIVMDEPELHLHPEAMISMIEKMREKFLDAQFWIATHSIELISYLVSTAPETTVLCLDQGEIEVLRSDSSMILDSLLGNNNNRMHIQQFYNSSDEYACICFITECLRKPDVVTGKKNDLQQDLITELLQEKEIIVDYGAGKGRLVEQLAMDIPHIAENIEYYAYNLPDSEDETRCREIIRKSTRKAERYYDNIDHLKTEIRGKADWVFLVNVLHEIPPKEWESVFTNISALLCETGRLVIIEREELMVGEAPHDCGFLMITENAAAAMFEQYELKRHERKECVVRYTIDRKFLEAVSFSRVKEGIERIKADAFTEIKKVRANQRTNKEEQSFKEGIHFAFWLNQYANASLALETI